MKKFTLIFILVWLSNLGLSQKAMAQACPLWAVEGKVAPTNLTKSGYATFVTTTPPVKYVHREDVENGTYTAGNHTLTSVTSKGSYDFAPGFWDRGNGDMVPVSGTGHAGTSGNYTFGPHTQVIFGDPYYWEGWEDYTAGDANWNAVATFGGSEPAPTVTRTVSATVDDTLKGYTSGTITHNYHSVYTLSTPYTTTKLVDIAFNKAKEFANDWSAGTPIAGVHIATNELSVIVAKAKFRIKYKVAKGQPFNLIWGELIQYDNTNYNGQLLVRTNELTGNGKIQYFPSEEGQELTCHASSTNENQSKTIVVLNAPSGCSDTACPVGANASLNSFNLNIGLGYDFGGKPIGSLLLFSPTPTASLVTPSALSLWVNENAEVIRDGNGDPRQVKGPQVLADITTSNNIIRILLYLNATTKSSGLWQTNSLTPYSTTVVELLGGDMNNVRTSITEQSVTRVSDFGWNWDDGADNGWSLFSGGGIKKEKRSWNTDENVETYTIRNADDTLVYQAVSVFTNIWPNFLISSQTIGTGAGAKTNQWYYYIDDELGWTNSGKLKLKIEADSGWTRYIYNGTNGLLEKEIRQFGNAATNATESLSRVTEYRYEGDISAIVPSLQIESLLGQEIGRKYTVYGITNVQEIVCQTPGAAVGASDNLITTTTYGIGEFAERPASILRPDGTATFYVYGSTNYNPRTNFMWTGQPDTGNASLLNGQLIITKVGTAGRIESVETKDFVSGSAGSRTSLIVYSNFDSVNRAQTITYLDGSTETRSFACCGMDNSTERDGTVTAYEYDPLKRLTLTTKNNISISNLLDAAGNTLATFRKGSDNSWVTNSIATYDLGGNAVLSKDGLLNTTGSSNYVNGAGLWVQQTTNADGGLKITTYNLDGTVTNITGSAIFPLRSEYGVESEGGVQRFYVKTTKLGPNTADTNEWTKVYSDAVGRSYKTGYSDGASAQQYYSTTTGQLTKSVDPDGVTMLYAYNAKGELEYQILDMARTGSSGLSGTNRVTKFVSDVTSDHSTTVIRKRTYVWSTDNVDSSTLIQTVEQTVDGSQTWTSNYGAEGNTLTAWATGTQTVTSTAPDGTSVVSVYTNGRLTSVTAKNSSGGQMTKTSYAYDPHGRQYQITDDRNGATTLTFNLNDQVITTSLPSANGVIAHQISTNYYDSMGRIWKTTLPDLTHATNVYNLQGLLISKLGSLTYPVVYAFDNQGRMTNMITYQNLATSAGAATNTWIYDSQRGWNTIKRYQDGKGYTNTYSAAGRLSTSTSARTIVTTYAYDNAGALAGVSYSGSSAPSISYTFDRRGRPKAISQNSITTTRTYNDAGQMLKESYSGGVLNGLVITNQYDAYLRRTNNGTVGINAGYSYNIAGRLDQVANANSTVSYVYHTNSGMAYSLTFKESGTTRMTTLKHYDYLNRLTSIDSGSGIASFAYNYNQVNQRTDVTLNDGSYWLYQYDSLGQLTSGQKLFSDDAHVPGARFTYAFDDIGNRTASGTGGDQSGSGMRSATYSPNLLNQYTNRTVPNKVDVIGTANSSSVVTVNSRPGYRKDSYFRNEVPVDNSSGAVWLSVTNKGSLVTGGSTKIVTTNLGNIFVPQTPEAFTYDADGNLLTDGRWTYTWNGAGQLVSMFSLTGNPVGSKKQLDFLYDYMGRRIQKIISGYVGGTYVAQSTNRFLYDGWNLIAELDETNAKVRNYMWGTDLSGKMRGAGGVGGLLAMKNSTDTHFVAFDGNGNVMTLVKASNGANATSYEYGPFGELLRVSGTVSSPVRFSTKYQDDETDWIYYGYRYFTPSTGRWVSRDPIRERGGVNLYGMVGSDLVNRVDRLGLSDFNQIPLTATCPAKCGVVTGPEYDPKIWTVGGTPFTWKATFKTGNIYSPKCCEVHQYISSNIAPLHEGFPSDMVTNTDYEDRDQHGKRYGYRSGDFSDLKSIDFYTENGYEGTDTPNGWPRGTTFTFHLVVVDTCNKNKTIYTSQPLTVQF